MRRFSRIAGYEMHHHCFSFDQMQAQQTRETRRMALLGKEFYMSSIAQALALEQESHDAAVNDLLTSLSGHKVDYRADAEKRPCLPSRVRDGG